MALYINIRLCFGKKKKYFILLIVLETISFIFLFQCPYKKIAKITNKQNTSVIFDSTQSWTWKLFNISDAEETKPSTEIRFGEIIYICFNINYIH